MICCGFGVFAFCGVFLGFTFYCGVGIIHNSGVCWVVCLIVFGVGLAVGVGIVWFRWILCLG